MSAVGDVESGAGDICFGIRVRILLTSTYRGIFYASMQAGLR